jgi:hypothetical protein
VKQSLSSYRYALGATLFGLILRAIPEFWAGTHLIGFDTFFYAGELSRLNSCFQLLGLPSELALGAITCPLAMVAGPVMAMKICASLLYGLLGLSVFHFSKVHLKRTDPTSLFITAFVLLQIAALRMSWDLYRNLLAVSLLLITLTILSPPRSRTKGILVTGLLIVIALTHQLIAALFLLIILAVFVWELVRRELTLAKESLLLLIPLLIFTILSVLVIYPTTMYEVSSNMWLFKSNTTILVPLGWFVAALYLPTAIPAIIGAGRNRFLVGWATVIIVILFLIIIGVPLGASLYDRWALMLFIPLGVFGAVGLLSIGRFFMGFLKSRVRFVQSHCKLVHGIILLASLLPYGTLAWTFMITPISRPYWYFDNPEIWNVGSGIPSTMQQNSIAFSDEQYVLSAFRWLNETMRNGDVLLTHSAFYGWALLYLRKDRPIIDYGSNLTVGMTQAERSGFSCEYVIWFVPNYGWDGPDPSLVGWNLVFKDGSIVIYDNYPPRATSSPATFPKVIATIMPLFGQV